MLVGPSKLEWMPAGMDSCECRREDWVDCSCGWTLLLSHPQGNMKGLGNPNVTWGKKKVQKWSQGSQGLRWNHALVSRCLIGEFPGQTRPSLVVQMVKNLPIMQETWVWSLGQEDPLENGMATHSSILPWRIPWSEESEELQSMGSQRVGHDWATNTFTNAVKDK